MEGLGRVHSSGDTRLRRTAVTSWCKWIEDETLKSDGRSGEGGGRCRGMSPSTGRGAARAEDAQGTPTQSHMSPSILVYEYKLNSSREGSTAQTVRVSCAFWLCLGLLGRTN